MMANKKVIALAGAVLFSFPAAAQSNSSAATGSAPVLQGIDKKVSDFNPLLKSLLGYNIYLYGSVAPEWTIWEPGIKTEQPRIFNFSGQGFTGLRFSAGVGVKDEELAFFNYSRPFDRSVERADVVQTGGGSGIETLQVVGRLRALRGVFGAFDNGLFQTLASLNAAYGRETFVGVASAKTNAKMLKYGAQLAPNGRGGYSITNSAQGITDIKAGTDYKFRTDLKDYEISVNVLPLFGKKADSDNGVELRVGGYWSEWARPAEIGNPVTFTAYGNSYPVVYEAKYRTKGVSFSIDNENSKVDKDGKTEYLKFFFGVRFGISDEIKTAFPGLLKAERPQFVGLKARLSHDFNLLSSRYGEVYFTPSASLDYRSFMQTIRDTSGNTIVSDKILDGERIYKLYGRLSVKF